MSSPFIGTFSDIIESCQDFLQGNGVAAHQQVIRRCIQTAYREIVSARDWNCMNRNGRVQLSAAETTGTVAYTHTGGTYERQVKLTGATWPSAWVEDASIRIGDVICDVESYKDTTTITLDATMNPGADVAAGATFTVYPRWYRLPAGFVSFSGTMEDSSWLLGQETSMAEIMARQKYDFDTGDIRWYAVGPVQDLYGAMGLYVHPASDTTEPIDFVYKARPRDIRYSGQDANDYVGTIAVTAGSAAVTGTSTAFASGHVGSILRISSSTTKPTGIDGANPWVEQRSIVAQSSATSITLDAAIETTRSGVKYVISDPIDLDISLYDAFLRNCEKQLAIVRNFKNVGQVIAVAEDALFRAKCADGRSTARKIAGGAGYRPLRLHDYGSVGEDVD